MAEHNDLGNLGEERAQAYLSSNGYHIRHCNWFFGKLELDIVAEKDGWLVIVEVKMHPLYDQYRTTARVELLR